MINPTSLYIHIPWCIRKCPYCDFNSHQALTNLPEENYIKALIADFDNDLMVFPPRKLESIFIGGGTPSLFSASSFEFLFKEIKKRVLFARDIEITLEANPGTVEQERFTDYYHSGINRLSLGIQSFNPTHLKALGRIHDAYEAHKAIETAYKAGFTNINLDLMYGLPEQSIADGLKDLHEAIGYQPQHISWYQLTLEPNTVFYKKPPPLPNESTLYTLEENGLSILSTHNFQRYEISAFSLPQKQSRHNLNYWLYGDYYGIGAGAHSKLSTIDGTIYRSHKPKQPNAYLRNSAPTEQQCLNQDEIIFEFMLNATRLEQAIPNALFSQRTGLDFALVQSKLNHAANKQLITLTPSTWKVTPLGRRFCNDLQLLFLP